MVKPSIVVSFEANDEVRCGITAGIDNAAEIIFLSEIEKSERLSFIDRASAVIVMRPNKDLAPEELKMLSGKLVQSFTAGVDSFPFDQIPDSTIVAHNGGAFAKPMAEYVVGVAISCFREFRERHQKLNAGEWDQLTPTRMLQGAVCGIIGYGSIGREVAHLIEPFGVKIHGVNRHGYTDRNIDFIGTLDNLDSVLRISDIVVIALGLNKQTRSLFNSQTFKLLKHDAVVINVARGAIVEQKALYDWLVANPEARACIDAWWREPIADGDFRTEYSFLELPNVFGSPHNSAIVYGAYEYAAQHAAKNVRHYIETGKVNRQVTHKDYA